MNKLTKVLGAAAVATLVGASGSAFTASNTVTTSVAGYGSNTVTGATATAVEHTLSADGTAIVSSKITFNASQQGRTVKASFDGATQQSCTLNTTFDVATCTYSPTFVTADSDNFGVSVATTPA